MKLLLNDQFEVSGSIKPGADSKSILEQVTNDIEKLSSKDFTILCCGTNDMGRLDSRVIFNDIISFIKRVSHTNLIL
jgi:hypothetical protein